MATGPLSQQEEKSMNDAETALDEAEKLLNDFIEKDWAAYRSALEKVSLTGDKIIIFPSLTRSTISISKNKGV